MRNREGKFSLKKILACLTLIILTALPGKAPALTGAEELAIGLAVELIAGLTAAAAQSGATQVRCKAQTTGPDGDDKKANLEFDTEQIFETSLDCDVGLVSAENGAGAGDNHLAWSELHYSDTAPAGSESWGPNLTGYKDKNGAGGYVWVRGYAEPDDDPEPGNMGSANCKGPNATCAAGVAIFALEGEVTEKLKKGDAEKVEPATGSNKRGARAAAIVDSISVVSFGEFFASPSKFEFLVDGDTVTIAPRFQSPIDMIHSTAELDVSAVDPNAPPAILPPRFLGLSDLGDELSKSTFEDAANAVPGLVPADSTAAELTIAGAALRFEPLAVNRLDGNGAERDELDLLTEYFASPTAVKIVAPGLAQTSYVPNVTHRELLVGTKPVSAGGIDPQIRDAVLPAFFSAIDGNGVRIGPDVDLVGILIGVEGNLLDALNLAAATPGSELNTRLTGLNVGDEFDASISVSSSGAFIQTMDQTVGALIDDFSFGDTFIFADAPGSQSEIEEDATILGGQREIDLAMLSSNSGEAIFLSTQGGKFSQDQADQAFGIGRLTWDGPDAKPGIPGAGDGRFDLRRGGANTFAIAVDTFESFGGEPLDISLGVEVILGDGTSHAANLPLIQPVTEPGFVFLPYHLLGLENLGDTLDTRAVSLVVDGSRTADYRIVIDSVATTRVATWPPYVDQFLGDSLFLQRQIPGTTFGFVNDPLVPGAQREATLELLVTERISTLDLISGEGGLIYFQGQGVLGRAEITWDGLDGNPSIEPNPLPGFNLDASGANALALNVDSLGFFGPVIGGLTIQLLIYPGDGGSPLIHPPMVLTEPIASPTQLLFPFEGFTQETLVETQTASPAGRDVAAVALKINGAGQDNVQLVLSSLQVVGPVCGNDTIEGDEACDDGNLDSVDGCSNSCEIEDLRQFEGITAGSSIIVTVAGESVNMEILSDMTAADVAILVASTLNEDVDLALLGITAAAADDMVGINDTFDSVEILDPILLPTVAQFAAGFGSTACCDGESNTCDGDFDRDCDVDGSDIVLFWAAQNNGDGPYITD